MLEALISLPLWALLLVSLSIYTLYAFVIVVFDPLRSIPGPFFARFTRWWYFWAVYKGDFERTNIALHEKYGTIVRISPNEYSVDDVAAAKAIYGHGNAFPKTSWYWPWQPPDPSKASLFSDLNDHRHSIQRRKFASMYSMSSLITYEPFVNNCTSLLLQRFSELARTNQSVNLQHWLQCYAFDVIGEITFRKRFGFLDEGKDKLGVFKAIDTRGYYSTFVGIFPWVHRWLYPLLPTTGGHGYVLQYTLDRIEERTKELKEGTGRREAPDIMTRILAEREKDGERMTRQDLVSMCQSNIGAGSDTTAITLSSILYNLYLHPQSLQTLRNELTHALSTNAISSPLTYTQSLTLPYLQSCIKEGLRLHPSTGLTMPRLITSPTGLSLPPHHLPHGSTIGINPWVAHHNTSIYGSDAHRWRPERWLEYEQQGRLGEVEKYFLSFGLGGRTCIGRNIALLEIGKCVAEVVARFDLVFGEELRREGGVRCENRWFVKQVNFRGRVVERKA